MTATISGPGVTSPVQATVDRVLPVIDSAGSPDHHADRRAGAGRPGRGAPSWCRGCRCAARWTPPAAPATPPPCSTRRMTDAPAAGRRWWGRRSTVVLTTGVVLLAGCSATQDTRRGDDGAGDRTPARRPDPHRRAAASRPPCRRPTPRRSGPPRSPTTSPAQALPTSQWWTSALVGPAQPAAVGAPAGGAHLRRRPRRGGRCLGELATGDGERRRRGHAVRGVADRAGHALGPDRHRLRRVRRRLRRRRSTAAALGVTVVQGSPLTWLDFRDGLSADLQVLPGAQLGDAQDVGGRSVTPVLVGRVDLGPGRRCRHHLDARGHHADPQHGPRRTGDRRRARRRARATGPSSSRAPRTRSPGRRRRWPTTQPRAR